MEVSDIICKVQTELKLPIDEQPKHMKNYMHTNMVKQAKQSLNTSNVQQYMHRELQKQRIAKLRLHHQKLLGVKVSNKNETFNGLPIGGPSVLDPPTKKKKKKDVVEEDSGEATSDDEIQNALFQKADAISLSIFDGENNRKRSIQ